MSYLAKRVTDYFEQCPHSMRQIEEQAGLPRMTLGSIVNNDAHPRPERLGQLLRVVPERIATEWLIAYIQDDVPEEWLPRLQILIEPLESDSGVLREPEVDYGPPATARALARLQTAMEKDSELARWFVKTVGLVLGD
jgi:hypothetical protein